MKKILIFITVFLIVILPIKLLAQEKTATISASEEKKIIELKEKIASKVAQLQKDNPQGRSGFITEVKNDSFSLLDQKNETYLINVDPIVTKYYQVIGNQRKEVGKKDLAKDQYVVVEGIINSNQIEANAVYIDESFLINSGQVIEINKSDYWIKLNTLEKESLILDIETYTKKYLLNIKTLTLENIGFSKIKEGDIVHFVIKKEGIKPFERASALRLIIIPQEFFLKQ